MSVNANQDGEVPTWALIGIVVMGFLTFIVTVIADRRLDQVKELRIKLEACESCKQWHEEGTSK